MSESHDAYVMVECDLPNGAVVKGKLIGWRTGMRINALISVFLSVANQKNLDELWNSFSAATGITEQAIEDACTPISLVELCDFIRRFTALLRPGATAVQGSTAPDTTPGPSPTPAPQTTT